MRKCIVLLFVILFSLNSASFAQSKLDIFGYVQASFNHFESWYNENTDYDDNFTYKFMGIGQMNLILAGQLTPDFTTFVNFEYLNDYSSDKGFGAFNLQEAYLRWDYKNYLKIKFGMAIPQFNNLYEIYNRTPLIPYLIRPKVYEVNFGNLIDVFDFLPQKALIHLNGNVPVGSFNFQYALWGGNPPNSLISSPDNDLIPDYAAFGQSAVNVMSFGSRLGILNNNIKFGISFSTDMENRQNVIINYDEDSRDLGNLRRYRFGTDLSITFGDLKLEGEYLTTKTMTTKEIDDSLMLWNSITPDLIGANFDKYFYYISLLYNFSDQFYGFVMYDAISDNFDTWWFGIEGYKGFHVGGGYNVNEFIVLKGQINFNMGKYETDIEEFPILKYSEIYYSFGASFAF